MNNKNYKNALISICLLLVGVASRIIPHEPNLTALGAITIFGAIYLPKKYAFVLPIFIMLISDAILGFHVTMPWVYGSYFLIGVLSLYMGAKNILYMPLLASILFFIITNFGVWATGTMYARTFAGLLECYTMALPFFRGTLAGDLVYTALLVGGFSLLKNHHVMKKHMLAQA